MTIVRALCDRLTATWSQKPWVRSSDYNSQLTEFATIDYAQCILDIDIGPGSLEQNLGINQVVGVDHSIDMLTRLPSEYLSINGDASYLPLKDSVFDVVLCRNLLQHMPNRLHTLKEMKRVTVSGGTILAFELAVHGSESIYPTELARIIEPGHAVFLSHSELYDLFWNAGLQNIQQKIAKVHLPWFQNWRDRTPIDATEREKIILYCEQLPDWYKRKYAMTIDRSIAEIDSLLTFSFLKGKRM